MKARVFALLALLLPCSIRDLARGQDLKDTSEVFRTPLKDQYVGALVEVFDQSGRFYGGRLWAATQDSMYILQKGDVVAIPQRSIRRITLTPEDINSASDLLGPIALGAYAGVCVFGFADGSTYLDPRLEPGGAILGAVLGAAVVGSIASLAPGSGESVTILSIDAEQHENNWESFRGRLAETSRSKLHLSVQASFPLRSSTYHKYVNVDPSYGPGSEGSDFMLLRSIHCDYALNDKFSLGLAYVNFKELEMFASRYDPQTAIYESAQTKYETGRAILLIGAGHPFRDRLPGKVFWEVGGGIGRSELSYTQTMYTQTGINLPVRSDQSIRGAAAAIMLYTELKFQLTRTFLIGFSADAVQVPGRFQDAIPAFAIKRKLIGSYSWGFSMGFRL